VGQIQELTERIAQVSLPTVLFVLGTLTLLRAALLATRFRPFRALADLIESALLAIGLVFLVLRPFVVQSFFIPSPSMRPTLWEGDHILVNKWSLRKETPKRGDVVVFRAPREADPHEKEFIKRVVGIPGDCIEVRDGSVLVGQTIYTRPEIRAVLGENVSVSDFPANLPPLRLTMNALWLGTRQIAPEEFARLTGQPKAPVTIRPGRVLRNGETLLEGYVAEDPQYAMEARTVPPGQLFVMGDNRNQSHDSHKWGFLPMNRIIGRAEWVFWPPPHAKRITNQ
jgi:signal peptidase I